MQRRNSLSQIQKQMDEHGIGSSFRWDQVNTIIHHTATENIIHAVNADTRLGTLESIVNKMKKIQAGTCTISSRMSIQVTSYNLYLQM